MLGFTLAIPTLLPVESHRTSMSVWLKEHLLGMVVFAIVTGVIANFAFEAIKKRLELPASQTQPREVVAIPEPAKLISILEPPKRMIKPAESSVVSDNRLAEPPTKIWRAESPPQNYVADRNVSSSDAARETRTPAAIPATKAPSIPITVPEHSPAQQNTLCPTGQVLVATTRGGLSKGEGKCEQSNCIDGIDVQATERAVARGVTNPDGRPIRVACL